MILSEYDVSFATKEYLIGEDYRIITWNPPGSQGTFTIPNPSKDPTYRGQTGSESPDIIAYNDKEILIIEAKDSLAKSVDDLHKMNNLISNPQRKEILLYLCMKQSEANKYDIKFIERPIVLGISIPYEEDISILTKIKITSKVRIFRVRANKKWDKAIIKLPLDPMKIFSIVESES